MNSTTQQEEQEQASVTPNIVRTPISIKQINDDLHEKYRAAKKPQKIIRNTDEMVRTENFKRKLSYSSS